MIDWTWNWMTKLPPIWQGGFGSCEACSATYAVAMRAYIQGYPLRSLSQLYIYWYGQGGASNPDHQLGVGMGSGVPLVASRGVCLESLMPRPPWQGVDTTTSAYSTACWTAVKTPPNKAAEADALNQIVVDWAYLTASSLDDRIAKAKAALDSGYVLTAFDPPDHEVCIWGYNQYGWIGPDSRSQNAEANSFGWAAITPDVIVRGVTYKNATLGIKPVPLPKPIIVIPPPTGNAMTVPQLQAAANALVVGQITQAQVDAIKTLATQLVADATPGPTPSPVPLPAGAWKIVSPDKTPHVTAGGVSWQAGDWNGSRMSVWRNGASSYGITGSELYYPGTGEQVYTKSPSPPFSWQYVWNGAAWGYNTVIPPGYA